MSALFKANSITDPAVFQWTFHPVTANNPEEYFSGTMEIGEATLTVGGETITTRAYRQEGTAYSIPEARSSSTRSSCACAMSRWRRLGPLKTET